MDSNSVLSAIEPLVFVDSADVWWHGTTRDNLNPSGRRAPASGGTPVALLQRLHGNRASGVCRQCEDDGFEETRWFVVIMDGLLRQRNTHQPYHSSILSALEPLVCADRAETAPFMESRGLEPGWTENCGIWTRADDHTA